MRTNNYWVSNYQDDPCDFDKIFQHNCYTLNSKLVKLIQISHFEQKKD